MKHPNKNKLKKQDEMIIVQKYENEMEAEMAMELLKSNKIESFILRDDPAGMGLNRGARLKVLARDFEQAIKLLNRRNSEEK